MVGCYSHISRSCFLALYSHFFLCLSVFLQVALPDRSMSQVLQSAPGQIAAWARAAGGSLELQGSWTQGKPAKPGRRTSARGTLARFKTASKATAGPESSAAYSTPFQLCLYAVLSACAPGQPDKQELMPLEAVAENQFRTFIMGLHPRVRRDSWQIHTLALTGTHICCILCPFPAPQRAH